MQHGLRKIEDLKENRDNLGRIKPPLLLINLNCVIPDVGLGDTENVPCDNCNKRQCDYCGDIAVEYLLQ